jgi:hypothetical protein
MARAEKCNHLHSAWAVDESGEGIISLEIYVKRGLPRIIVYQDMSFLSAHYCPQRLMEGVAVYSVSRIGR